MTLEVRAAQHALNNGVIAHRIAQYLLPYKPHVLAFARTNKAILHAAIPWLWNRLCLKDDDDAEYCLLVIEHFFVKPASTVALPYGEYIRDLTIGSHTDFLEMPIVDLLEVCPRLIRLCLMNTGTEHKLLRRSLKPFADQLHHLKLRCAVVPSGVRPSTFDFHQLQSLDVSDDVGTKLTDDVMQRLLSNNAATLHTLSLYGLSLTEKTLQHLSSLQNLHTLSLRINEVMSPLPLRDVFLPQLRSFSFTQWAFLHPAHTEESQAKLQAMQAIVGLFILKHSLQKVRLTHLTYNDWALRCLSDALVEYVELEHMKMDKDLLCTFLKKCTSLDGPPMHIKMVDMEASPKDAEGTGVRIIVGTKEIQTWDTTLKRKVEIEWL